MAIIDHSTTQHHHVVELCNTNGHLIHLSFPSIDEKRIFMATLKEYAEEVDEMEDEKRERLHSLTGPRAQTAKFVLEQIYLHGMEKRYGKYPSLRQMRLALQAQSQVLMGKRVSKSASQKSAASSLLDPVLKPVEKELEAFGIQIKLLAPCPSPEEIVTQAPTTAETEEDQEGQNTLSIEPKHPPEKRKRRNTIIGYSSEPNRANHK
jgi:hypothetical protein